MVSSEQTPTYFIIDENLKNLISITISRCPRRVQRQLKIIKLFRGDTRDLPPTHYASVNSKGERCLDFYLNNFCKLSDLAKVGAIAHEFAHVIQSKKFFGLYDKYYLIHKQVTEDEYNLLADKIAMKWGFVENITKMREEITKLATTC